MTEFIVASIGLLVLFALVLLFPLRAGSRRLDTGGSNRDWYALRQRELAADAVGDSALVRDAQLRMLEDSVEAGNTSDESRSSFRRAWLIPPMALFAAALYWQLGSAPDVVLAREFAKISDETTAEQIQALMTRLESRSVQRPGNLHYQALLGRYYMGGEDYARAAEVYSRLAQVATQDPQIQAFAAQSEYLASGRKLNQQAQMRAEQALSLDPAQRTALGLLGMAAFEQGQYRGAIDYWRRLLATEPPGSESAQMIRGVIARAEARLSEEDGSVPVLNSRAAAPSLANAGQGDGQVSGASVRVRLVLADGVSVPPSASLFVLARKADATSRMPIAVQRLSADQLPLEIELSDANSMAGQKLSESGEVMVFAQLSPTGQPGEANASHLGQAGPLLPGASPEMVEVVLRPREN